jgi:hypothetical protein
LSSRRLDLEVSWDVTSEYTRFESFDMSTDVGLGSKQMTLIHVTKGILVSVWHDDVTAKRFNLNTKISKGNYTSAVMNSPSKEFRKVSRFLCARLHRDKVE